jgi:hypothetical protein
MFSRKHLNAIETPKKLTKSKVGNNSSYLQPCMTLLTPLFLFSEWFVVLAAFFWVLRNSTWVHHIPFLAGLLLLHLFVGVAPLYFWFFGPFTILSYPYSAKFDKATGIYLVGIMAFIAGYSSLYFRKSKSVKIQLASYRSNCLAQRAIPALLVFLIVCWIGVLLNFYLSGVNLAQVLNPSNRTPATMLFSIPIYNGFLESLANSFISILLLLFAFSGKKAWVWLLIGFHVCFFFLAGWRFRIMLMLLGIAVYYLPQVSFKSIWKWSLAVSAGFLLMLWVSQNRMAISKRMFHLVSFSISDYDTFRIVHEVGSCRTFMATLLFIKENSIAPDFGASFYLPIYWRFQPSSHFEGGVRPKPPLLELEKAWIPKDVKQNLNPGVCNLEEYYLLLGWPGLIVLMAIFGLALHAIPKLRTTPLQTGAQVVYSAYLFQFVSRGYLPQQLKLLQNSPRIRSPIYPA